MLLTLARVVTASLLIASAAAFATGAVIERHIASSESHRAQQHAEVATPGENHPESAGSAGSRSDSNPSRPEAGHERPAAHATEQTSENLLGINPEATGLIVVAVALSLLLAALILTLGSPLLAAGAALAMLAFAALDVRELIHQVHESRPGLAALAATVAVLHLAAGAAALRIARDPRSLSSPVVAD